MPSKFRLELDIVIDGNAALSVIEAARRCHTAEETMTTVDEAGAEQTLRAEEFIDGIEDALMELVERNPLLANERVEIQRVACKPASAWPAAGPLADRLRSTCHTQRVVRGSAEFWAFMVQV